MEEEVEGVLVNTRSTADVGVAMAIPDGAVREQRNVGLLTQSSAKIQKKDRNALISTAQRSI